MNRFPRCQEQPFFYQETYHPPAGQPAALRHACAVLVRTANRRHWVREQELERHHPLAWVMDDYGYLSAISIGHSQHYYPEKPSSVSKLIPGSLKDKLQKALDKSKSQR